MKTYTNKSNAARAAKAANGGTTLGLALYGVEGAWYYAPQAAPVVVQKRNADGASVLTAPAKKAPAKKAAAKKVPAGKHTAKVTKVATKGRVTTVKAKLDVYDPKHGPTQGRIRGYVIDADRDEKHGVKRRSAGTIGGRLWAAFDKLSARAGGPEKLEIAAVKDHKDVANFNKNKVVIEFYLWRKYHGVRGRGKKQKVDK